MACAVLVRSKTHNGNLRLVNFGRSQNTSLYTGYDAAFTNSLSHETHDCTKKENYLPTLID